MGQDFLRGGWVGTSYTRWVRWVVVSVMSQMPWRSPG